MFMNTRNWTTNLAKFSLISLVGTLFNLFLADVFPTGHLKGAIYAILLTSLKYWLMMFIVIVSSMLPLYFIKQIREVVMWPQFYRQQKNFMKK